MANCSQAFARLPLLRLFAGCVLRIRSEALDPLIATSVNHIISCCDYSRARDSTGDYGYAELSLACGRIFRKRSPTCAEEQTKHGALQTLLVSCARFRK